jgi:hypothetical protein
LHECTHDVIHHPKLIIVRTGFDEEKAPESRYPSGIRHEGRHLLQRVTAARESLESNA